MRILLFLCRRFLVSFCLAISLVLFSLGFRSRLDVSVVCLVTAESRRAAPLAVFGCSGSVFCFVSRHQVYVVRCL